MSSHIDTDKLCVSYKNSPRTSCMYTLSTGTFFAVDILLNAVCICMSFRSAVGHGEASGAHNGVQMQLHWLTVLELKSLVLELQATNSIGS